MAEGPALILQVLDRYLSGTARVRLMGGAALVLAYGQDRTTEDADLLMDDAEAEFLAEERGFGDALEQANAELAPHGLYISHLWGPEQQILTRQWRANCRPVSGLDLKQLSVEALGPLDLIVSKLARGDEGDLEDIRYLIRTQALRREEVAGALDAAMVPEILKDSYASARPRVEALLAELS